MKLTYDVARRRVRADSSIRAAVITADGAPMVKHESCRVELFKLVKDAEAKFRAEMDTLKAQGFEQTYGTIGRGLVRFEAGGRCRYVALDKR